MKMKKIENKPKLAKIISYASDGNLFRAIYLLQLRD